MYTYTYVTYVDFRHQFLHSLLGKETAAFGGVEPADETMNKPRA